MTTQFPEAPLDTNWFDTLRPLALEADVIYPPDILTETDHQIGPPDEENIHQPVQKPLSESVVGNWLDHKVSEGYQVKVKWVMSIHGVELSEGELSIVTTFSGWFVNSMINQAGVWNVNVPVGWAVSTAYTSFAVQSHGIDSRATFAMRCFMRMLNAVTGRVEISFTPPPALHNTQYNNIFNYTSTTRLDMVQLLGRFIVPRIDYHLQPRYCNLPLHVILCLRGQACGCDQTACHYHARRSSVIEEGRRTSPTSNRDTLVDFLQLALSDTSWSEGALDSEGSEGVESAYDWTELDLGQED